jgi:hypothetical protein
VKKAAKDVVELQEAVLEGPSLDQIIGEWKDWKIQSASGSKSAATSAGAAMPVEAPTSASSSSSSSSDSDSGEHSCK